MGPTILLADVVEERDLVLNTGIASLALIGAAEDIKKQQSSIFIHTINNFYVCLFN
jgi:hypothetical protein